jgi:nucleotide-binding universal stress UspA family protein
MSELLDNRPQNPADRAKFASTLRTVLVQVGVGPQDLPRLRVAAALAGRFDATLYGVACEEAPPLGAIDPTGLTQGAWYAGMQEQLRIELQQARGVFDSAIAGLKAEWAAVQAMPAETLMRLSRGADLIVADSRPLSRYDEYRTADAAQLMLGSGRPVLLTPPSAEALKGEAVVVAWKDTRESRRALSDAMPLLAAAKTVLVLEICDKDDAHAAELRTAAVAAGLARHDIPALSRATVAPSERVASELDVAADAIGADLIVAGGYGHSRLGEWFFGGVTRDLLRQPERFVLLSH